MDYFFFLFFFSSCFKKRFHLEYSVEVSPPTEAPIKSILYYRDTSWKQCENVDRMLLESPDNNKEKLLGGGIDGVGDCASSLGGTSGDDSSRKYNLTFDGLDPDLVYTVIFSTEINGMTIMQTIREFDCEDV